MNGNSGDLMLGGGEAVKRKTPMCKAGLQSENARGEEMSRWSKKSWRAKSMMYDCWAHNIDISALWMTWRQKYVVGVD